MYRGESSVERGDLGRRILEHRFGYLICCGRVWGYTSVFHRISHPGFLEFVEGVEGTFARNSQFIGFGSQVAKAGSQCIQVWECALILS